MIWAVSFSIIGLLLSVASSYGWYKLGLKRGERWCSNRLESNIDGYRNERDRYRQIAQSHEISWRGFDGQWSTHPRWHQRDFEFDIEKNLEVIASELTKDFGAEQHLKLKFSVWADRQNSWTYWLEESGTIIDNWNMEGSAKQLTEQMRLFLKDPRKKFASMNGEWVCQHPITFKTTIMFFHTQEKPEIKVVEVAVPTFQPEVKTKQLTDSSVDEDRLLAMIEVAVHNELNKG